MGGPRAISADGGPDGAGPRASAGQVAAVVCGNALEFYDFLTYAYFALQIGRSFFPSSNPNASLLASLATFGVGFGMRPVGAAVLGPLGDRIGRRPAMLLCFGLMGLGMTGLALTPPYAQIGVAAPVLAVVWRLIQGFALGGEVGPSTAFLAEVAGPTRRGLLISFQLGSQRLATLVAGLVGLVLANRLSGGALDAWGWRLAFLIGAAIIPFGLWLRSRLPETLLPAGADETEEPGTRRGSALALMGLAGFVVLAGGTIASYVADYLTTYATHTLRMGSSVAFAAPAAGGLAGVLAAPIGGWLSDRLGRKPVMLGSWAVVLVGAIPMFVLLEHSRSLLALVALAGGLTAFGVMAITAVMAALSEGLPMRIRSGGLGLIYGLAIAAFGGSAQFVVAWLTDLTHDPLAPAWYLTAAVGLSLLAMLAMPETAPVRAAKGAHPLTTARIPA